MMGGHYIMCGKSFPDTQPIAVKKGQTVHLRLFGVDALSLYPMQLHGHTFKIDAEDGHPLAQPIEKDTVQAARETYELVIAAWAPAGSVYPFHCHILLHLMNPGQTGEEMDGLITLVKDASTTQGSSLGKEDC